jgi:hypothetical protein
MQKMLTKTLKNTLDLNKITNNIYINVPKVEGTKHAKLASENLDIGEYCSRTKRLHRRQQKPTK